MKQENKLLWEKQVSFFGKDKCIFRRTNERDKRICMGFVYMIMSGLWLLQDHKTSWEKLFLKGGLFLFSLLGVDSA